MALAGFLLEFLNGHFMQSLEFWMGGEGGSYSFTHGPNPLLTLRGRRDLKNIETMKEGLLRAQ